MDPAQIAAAVQHCPIPLDSALQVSAWGPLDADPVYQVTKQSNLFLLFSYLLCFVHFRAILRHHDQFYTKEIEMGNLSLMKTDTHTEGYFVIIEI